MKREKNSIIRKKEWHRPQLYYLKFRETMEGNVGFGADGTSGSGYSAS